MACGHKGRQAGRGDGLAFGLLLGQTPLPRLLHASEAGRGRYNSAQRSDEEQRDHREGEDQTQDARAAVLVLNHADEAQDKPERGPEEYGQPAKGCEGRPSARLGQPQHHERRQGGEREVKADPA